MGNPHGSFIWYELMTPDAPASVEFYSGLLGWQVSEDPEYREITASEGQVGGMLQLTPEMTEGGARPIWLGYVAVDDVDRALAAIGAAGGRTVMAPRDLPTAGRIAMAADPQGVPFYVMTPSESASDESHAFAAERPMKGHCAWNELSTTDPAAAWTFYGGQFGWVKDGDMDMGPLGKYEFVRHGSHMLGAIMPKMPESPVSIWTYYFRVPDIDVANAFIKDHGGTALMEPMEIPGGEFSLTVLDPHGATVGLVGPRNA